MTTAAPAAERMGRGVSIVLTERLLQLSPRAVSFAERGWECVDPAVRTNLEKILATFVAGYNVALKNRDYGLVSRQLSSAFDPHHVGFAYEGAGMCYALFDLLAPWSRSRLRAFTDDAGQKHDYIATVGAGFAVARVPWGGGLLDRYLHRLKSTVAWCVIDGYGFHQGIFHPEWFTAECREAPAAFPPYARQIFDAGVGRSFWWTQGANPAAIGRAVARFPHARRAEMWCGIGTAAAYAGGISERALQDLLEQSGTWRADFLSGFPFAARMRQKGENPSPWTDRACLRLLHMTAGQAADLLVSHVSDIVTELNGGERALRESGYGLLRERLRGEATRKDSRKPALAAVV
jgi:hypothetical protein